MVSEKMRRKYARLAIRRGVNIQEGQMLIIRASVEIRDFVRLCVEEAYAAGAGMVDVQWRDAELDKLGYEFRSEASLSEVPQWMYDRKAYEQEKKAAYLSLASDQPGLMADVDQTKIQTWQSAFMTKMHPLDRYLMNNEGQWCVIGVPTAGWAKVVFPGMDEASAYEALEENIYAVCHVTEDNDPVAEWQQHDEVLIRHSRQLNEYQFKALHFTSGLGTDLTVKLVKDHIWVGGGCETPQQVYFDPNMPTEEVFCMPERDGTDGIVYASKPLSYNGKVIKDFWLRFEKGRVTAHGAAEEEEALTQLLDFDEGSRHLGEVALVPYDSPVSAAGVLFFETLYDENAACHLALGRPYAENLKGGPRMSEDELKACGANDSMQHEDFMFGTADLSVDGILEDGRKVPVFRNGNFVF